MSHSDSVVAGVTLLAMAPVVLVVEGPVSMPGRYDGGFWRTSLDDKLDHIVTDLAGWRRIGLAWIPTLCLAVAGMTAFTALVASAGSAGWAWAALGIYLMGAIAWFIGVLVQTNALATAAQTRAGTGLTPELLAGFWSLGWWCEVTFVVAANVAAIGWGVAMVNTGYPATWMGWTAIAVGAAAVAWAATTRNVFPHLGILVPLILGVALVVS